MWWTKSKRVEGKRRARLGSALAWTWRARRLRPSETRAEAVEALGQEGWTLGGAALQAVGPWGQAREGHPPTPVLTASRDHAFRHDLGLTLGPEPRSRPAGTPLQPPAETDVPL